jgi:hypothetical protein
MEWQWKISNAAAIASAVAAWIAALHARRSYKLAVRRESSRRPSLEIYLVNGHIRRLGAPLRRLFVFKLLITNKSDAANALKDLQLVVHYTGRQGTPGNITISHDARLGTVLSNFQEELLAIPCGIPAREVVGGVAIFAAPEELLQEFQIESYTITAIDSFGNPTEREAILLQEVRDAQMETGLNPAKQ